LYAITRFKELKMRIAISSEENKGLESKVSHHFGRCPFFVLVEVAGEEFSNVDVIANPYFAHHSPGQVPGFISEQKVDLMISGGMGRRAIDFFQQFGVQTATGASGSVEQTLRRFLAGELPSAQPCHDSVEHEKQGHRHHHHH